MGWRASFPRFRVGGAPGLLATATEKLNSILFQRMNVNGKLTETENVIFTHSTEFLRMNAILTYFCNGALSTEVRLRISET